MNNVSVDTKIFDVMYFTHACMVLLRVDLKKERRTIDTWQAYENNCNLKHNVKYTLVMHDRLQLPTVFPSGRGLLEKICGTFANLVLQVHLNSTCHLNSIN